MQETNEEKEVGGTNILTIDPSPVKKKEKNNNRDPEQVFPMKPPPEEAIDFLAKDSK